MIDWLEQHPSTVAGFWTEAEFTAVRSRTAEGDHVTLVTLLAMLKEKHGIHAAACFYHYRGPAYDCFNIHTPDTCLYIPTITNTIYLGYTGCHYLSVLTSAPCVPNSQCFPARLEPTCMHTVEPYNVVASLVHMVHMAVDAHDTSVDLCAVL